MWAGIRFDNCSSTSLIVISVSPWPTILPEIPCAIMQTNISEYLVELISCSIVCLICIVKFVVVDHSASCTSQPTRNNAFNNLPASSTAPSRFVVLNKTIAYLLQSLRLKLERLVFSSLLLSVDSVCSMYSKINASTTALYCKHWSYFPIL